MRERERAKGKKGEVEGKKRAGEELQQQGGQ